LFRRSLRCLMASPPSGVVLLPSRGSDPCTYGQSVWDALRQPDCGRGAKASSSRGPFFDEQLVTAEELAPGELTLGPCEVGSRGEGRQTVSFGRAAASLPGAEALWGRSVLCPLVALSQQGLSLPPFSPHARLAVVVVPNDGAGRVLLTQRTAHMRTFPRCWVFPGGSVDAGESLLVAGSRELREETGLSVPPAAMQLLCLWESVFPTSCEDCIEVGQVKGHAIAAFVTATVPQEELSRQLRLQSSECQGASWVPLSLLRSLHAEPSSRGAAQPGLSSRLLPGWVVR
ncbi:unnamed protein product, partial [Polarella glacialis]